MNLSVSVQLRLFKLMFIILKEIMLIGHKEKWKIELLQLKMECMTLFLNLVMPREEPSGQQTTNTSLGRGLSEKKGIAIKEISLAAEKMNATHDRFRRPDSNE